MKKFNDLKVGDTVYKVVYTSDSGTPLRIQKEKVTVIDEVHSGTVIKTEDIVEDGTFQDTHGYFVVSHWYFVDSDWYNAECTANGNTEIWWDKFGVQELINNFAVEYQRRITEMLDVIKD